MSVCVGKGRGRDLEAHITLHAEHCHYVRTRGLGVIPFVFSYSTGNRSNTHTGRTKARIAFRAASLSY